MSEPDVVVGISYAELWKNDGHITLSAQKDGSVVVCMSHKIGEILSLRLKNDALNRARIRRDAEVSRAEALEKGRHGKG